MTVNAPHDVTRTPAGWEVTDADGKVVVRSFRQQRPHSGWVRPGETLWQVFTVSYEERIEV